MKTSALAFALVVVPAIATAQPAVRPPDPGGAPTVYGAPVDASPVPGVSAAVPAEPAPEEPEEPMARIGAELSLLPFGTLEARAGDVTITNDTAIATGIGGMLQHPINRNVTVEFAPRVLLHVKGEGAERSATELDLRVRLTAGGYPTPGLRFYGAVAPGYSMMFLRDDMEDTTTPNGFIIGLAAGAAFDVAVKTKLTVETGYQLGYQAAKVLGKDIDLRANLLHFALGVLVDL